MKSWLIAIISIIRCILYPGTKVILASGTKGQAKLVITQKVREFWLKYPMVKREILDIKTGANEVIVFFRNGSTMEAVVSNDNSRGYRGNVLVLDEYRMIKEDILKQVLKKFLTVNRQPPYLVKEEYKHLTEANREIYISSCWYKNHWSYKKFRSLLSMMNKTQKAFVCGLNYKLAMYHGILSKELVESEMTAEDFDALSLVISDLYQKWYLKNLVNLIIQGCVIDISFKQEMVY